jgi:hypothetical protein
MTAQSLQDARLLSELLCLPVHDIFVYAGLGVPAERRKAFVSEFVEVCASPLPGMREYVAEEGGGAVRLGLRANSGSGHPASGARRCLYAGRNAVGRHYWASWRDGMLVDVGRRQTSSVHGPFSSPVQHCATRQQAV